MNDDLKTEKQTRPLRDLVETIFRHRRKVFVFFGVVLLTALVLLSFSPVSYTSMSKLIVHRGRESVFVDPSMGGAAPLYKEWESEINTELEILNSRELVAQVVETMGPAAFIDERPPDETGRLGPIRRAFNPVRLFFRQMAQALSPDESSDVARERLKQVNQAIQIVEKGLQINVRPKSDIITVAYTSRDPELARQVVDVLIKNYLERRIDLHQIPGGYQFFSQQTELLRAELDDTAVRILAAKKEGHVDAISDTRAALETSIEEMKASRLKVKSDLAAAKARAESMRAMLSQQSDENVHAILGSVEYKKLQSTMLLEEASLAALAAQDREIDKQLEQLQADLLAIEKNEPAIRRLEREQDLLEEKYRTYSENREQARINQELETRKISNVTIVQHATLPEEANPSGKMMKLAAALFLGVFGAGGLAFGFDSMDPSLHSEADVLAKLNRKPLAQLPHLRGAQLDPAYRPPLRKERKSRWILHSGKRSAADGEGCFQELYLRLLSMGPAAAADPLVIGLCSSVGGEGVSTVAAKLAAAFSQDERFPNVLLLDANLTKHSNQMIRQRSDLPFVYHKIRDEKEGDEESLPVTANTLSRYLAQARRESYNVIIIDVPPVEEGSYTLRVVAETDVTGLLVECNRTPWRTVKRSIDLLEHAGVSQCDVILNRQQYTMPKWLYKKL
jgi:uncharacterized protein involved in exopolysaccharide biosynthesis/Mrp family chromosome partitioning ATPase